MQQKTNKFPKKEKLCSSTLTGRLFSEGDRSIGSFPVRFVWMDAPACPGSEPVQILISAPKRHLHEAVLRNRVKRQIREFYRKNSLPLKQLALTYGRVLYIAVLYSDHNLWDSQRLDQRLANGMSKLMAKLETKWADSSAQSDSDDMETE